MKRCDKCKHFESNETAWYCKLEMLEVIMNQYHSTGGKGCAFASHEDSVKWTAKRCTEYESSNEVISISEDK